jgi:hypothetical protein
LQTNLENLQTRQDAFDSILSNVDENIRTFENKTSQALTVFETAVTAQVGQYIGSMWNHFDQVIAETTDQFDRTIQNQYQETQQELVSLSHSLWQMAADTAANAAASAEAKREIAESWLFAAEQYCSYIQQYYNFEQFIPGRVEWLERQLEQTRQNLEMGLSEAVIATSQQLYLTFSELRIELERLQNEWIFLYQAAWEGINRLLIQANECQYIQAIDLDGNLIDLQIDLDYWSEGQLSDTYDRASAIRDQIGDPAQLPDREFLRRLLEEEIPNLLKELEEIAVMGRINVLNSQLRINLADLVVRALQEQGFALKESDYDERDMRLAYGAHMLNQEGNQVIIQVAPVGKKLGENELHLRSMDNEQRTEHELEQRWSEISQSLNRYGVEVGPYTRLDRNQNRKAVKPVRPGWLSRNKNGNQAMKSSQSDGYRTSTPDYQDG